MENPAPTLRQRAEKQYLVDSLAFLEIKVPPASEALQKQFKELRLRLIEQEMQNEHDRLVLEILASPRPIAERFSDMILAYESFFPEMHGSILLLDKSGEHLRHVAAPSLPATYCQAIDGVRVGPKFGSFATAAHTGRTTIVSDISQDPLWHGFKELAQEYGLEACWSVPMVNFGSKVLGTFAFYFKYPRTPTHEELKFIERSAQLVSLALEHDLALADLKESEAQYRGLIELSPDIIAVAHLGKIAFINQAGIDFIGFENADQIVGRSLFEFFHPDSHEEVSSRLRQLDTGSHIPPIELKFLDKDGKSMLAESRAINFPWKGAIAKLAIIRDISSRKRAEQALIHSEERYRTLATVSPVGLYRTDPEGRNTFINEHFCSIVGCAQADIIGKTGAGTVYPKDLDWVRSSWKSTMAKGEQFKAEFRLIKPDGSIVWVIGNSKAETGEDGAIIGYIGTLTEITERKQAEILLGLQKRSLALGMSGASLQIVLDDLVNYVVNESNEALTGILKFESPKLLVWTATGSLPKEFLKAMPSYDIMAPAFGEIVASWHSREIRITPDLGLTNDEQKEHQIALAHGFHACIAQPILGPNQQVLGVITNFYGQIGVPSNFDCKLLETAAGLAALAIDRTQKEAMVRVNLELAEENRRIMEASRMKSEFMAVMSHELRTPLNAVIGFSQLLIDNKMGHLNPKQSEYLGDILDGGMHLLRLITDMLDLAKIEAGKMQLSLESMLVNQTIREVCDNLLSIAMGKEINLRIATDSTIESAIVDSHKFRQVLYNLVSNAIKFSPKGSDVLVSTSPTPAGDLRLAVSDQGIGIKKEDLGKLFQQFQQLDTGSKRQYTGTGLGLLITKRLVELHGGTVGVESEFGKGSTFYATFPLPNETNPI
jgi:PAS domain S-box-containing protein